MKGVILAAGRGSRLGRSVHPGPKALLPLGHSLLIERQLSALAHAGIADAVTVVGFQARRVRSICGGRTLYVENARFAETENLYSLWLARRHLQDGFVVLNGDVLFHPLLLAELVAFPHDDALLVAPTRALHTPLGREEMKVRLCANRVVDISKELSPGTADGEYLGIAKFGPTGAQTLIRHVEKVLRAGGERAWLPAAFRSALQDLELATLTACRPWIEIDFAEDYRRACEVVLPALENASAALSTLDR